MAEMSWIWLNPDKYPDYQNTYYTYFCDRNGYKFCVAGFYKNYYFDKNIVKAEIEIFADTKFWLYTNNKFTGTGPVCQGGDYDNKFPMPVQYKSKYILDTEFEKNLSFYVKVQLSPEVQADMSCGRGGLWLGAEITFDDGTKEYIATDSSWMCRIEGQYITPAETDYRIIPSLWENASVVESVWNIKASPIPNLSECYIGPEQSNVVYIPSKEKVKSVFLFDKIYSGYISFKIESKGEYEIHVSIFEKEDKITGIHKIKGAVNVVHRALRMDSIGGFEIEAVNKSGEDIYIKDIGLIFTCYPGEDRGRFFCSDESLNTIYRVGSWTSRICRQTIELDSPLHQENLGCVGDYFIESLITYYTAGDERLTRFDIVRIADYMRMTKGKLFHATYSLIWVQMIYDYYIYSGDISIFVEVVDVVEILLERFDGYIGDNGVIENPHNFMFVDWVPVDGYNLHHPPKALGQAVMTAFYYKALVTASEIFRIINKDESKYIQRAEDVYKSFNKCFYDSERGIYFDGLNTASDTGDWIPENTDKRYYSKHTNTLAALYGLAENGRQLMEKILNDDTLIDTQPYFMHFVLEAIYKTGLFKKYGLREIRRWTVMTDECRKGMKEAWGDFPGYEYDYSHAWGCTPTYQLPSKLLGLEIIQSGFRKIRIDPQLFDLEFAEIEVPTPYGNICCKMERGAEAELFIPSEIEYCIKNK